MDDDFEDIVKTGPNLAPCTIRCGLVGREGRQARRVSVTFRTAKLDPEVVRVLSAGIMLSAAYSPSQRVVRVKADPNGRYRLTLAPRANDVYLLRFPYTDKMPWIDKRVATTLDVNPEQGAVFIELPGITPERAPALPPPGPSGQARIAPPVSEIQISSVGTKLGQVVLLDFEAAIVQILRDGAKRSKVVVSQTLVQKGFADVKINAALGRLRQKLEPLFVDITESTDKSAVWMTPMALAALERAIGGKQ